MPFFSALTTYCLNRCRTTALVSLFLLLAAGAVLASSVPALPDHQQLELGKRIYREGVLPSGAALTAQVEGGIPLSGAQAACARCHQRSALGTSEGGRVVPPLRGTMSAQSQIAGQAPDSLSRIYSPSTLARVLRDGMNSTGQRLDALMPRYQLSQTEVAALHAYLSALPAKPDPGVNEREIHFATVIAGAVNPASRQALLDVLQTYFKEKNAETRGETLRRNNAARNPEKMYRAHRTWVLHVWELRGLSESWPKQLENYYRQQPVFALLSGIGEDDWQPVHDFCERHEIPCLLPILDAPPAADADFYSIYFSKGVMLEAQVLAKHLREPARLALNRKIVQVYRDDSSGARAAQALRTALLESSETKLIDQVIAGKSPTAKFWADLWKRERPSVLMLWLNAEDLAGLPAMLKPAKPVSDIFLSSSLIGDNLPRLPSLPGQIYLLHPFVSAQDRDRTLARTRIWLRSRKITAADERLSADSYFTLTVAGEALMHMRDNFSRDYFIERVEHAVDTSLNSSIYPRVSLGPGQRYASKGAYIIRLQSGKPTTPGGWIIP